MNKTYEELSKLPPIAIFEPEMDINEEEYITMMKKAMKLNVKTKIRYIGFMD